MKTNRLLCITLLLMLGSLQAATVKIPADFPTIQAGIDSAAVGDTVLVDPGTYPETIDFHGKRLVVGSLFLTSGDTSYIRLTVIDGNQDSSVVSFENSEPEGTELCGFSITNGLGTGDWPNVRGGGIQIKGAATPTIRDCYIYGNTCVGNSNRGGGIYASSQRAVIRNCKIYGNTALVAAGIGVGNGANGTIIENCDITGNFGVGVLFAYSQNITISRTFIRNNDSYGLRSFATDNARLIHSVLTGNGNAALINSSTATGNDTLHIVNSVVFNNEVNYDFAGDSLVKASYSLLQGGSGNVWFGAGCMDEDPQLDTLTSAPLPGSPLIDSGDPNYPVDPDGTIADVGVHYYPQATTGIGEDITALPATIELLANYPNPFNPTTTIRYRLGSAQEIRLQVFDIAGRAIVTLASGIQAAGWHSIDWNGFSDDGYAAASGIYFYQLQTRKGVAQTRSMILLK